METSPFIFSKSIGQLFHPMVGTLELNFDVLLGFGEF